MVGHQVLVLGIGVRVPTPQQPSVERGSTEVSRPNVQPSVERGSTEVSRPNVQPSVERGSTEVSRPNVQTRAEFLNRAGSVRGAYEKL